MFLKLHDIEDSEKKDFILETLHREFRDVVIEARKVFKHFNMLSSPVNVVGTNKEETQVPIPSKLLGLHEAFENNFDWICPKNLFSELSEPKQDHKGFSKTCVDAIQFLLKILLQLILMLPSILLDLHLSAPSSKALKKITLER
jgi:hypothetical protein